ncbi:uncharacterized protein LOC123532133 [Mercenaria mercenaria]|uniref:uncharacterized protein LOC123532133 n=1 Tax=Mercenaria mercenaria TaxID=6596 RepID=UPI00234EB7FC|nr:uncharacterized protein LOC123532133 [Mercenaria mercenaria]
MMRRLFIFAIFVFVGFVQSFNYKDEIAQGTCTSLITEPDHVYAVRRTCTSNAADTCDTVCSKMGKTCFNSLHVYNGVELTASDTGKEALHTYRYNSCESAGCGPNFCCCSGL